MTAIDTTSTCGIWSASHAVYIGVDGYHNLVLTTNDYPAPPGIPPPLIFDIIVSPHDSTLWNICSYAYSNEYRCMDQWVDNASQPALQLAGYYTGQQWTLTPTMYECYEYWEMQSGFAGPNMYLTSYGIGEHGLAMSEAQPNGQLNRLFELVKVHDPESVNHCTTSTSYAPTMSVPSTTTVPSSSTTKSNPSSSDTAQDATTVATNPASKSSGQEDSNGLSNESIIGLAVGLPSALVAIGTVVRWLFRRTNNQLLVSLPHDMRQYESMRRHGLMLYYSLEVELSFGLVVIMNCNENSRA